jgi:hypothetical protein
MYTENMEPGIRIQTKDENVYYSVQWSPLTVAERHEIARKVPAVAGIYEIYWMDRQGKLRLFRVGSARYGGLRSEIRRLTDPELTTDADLRTILDEKEIWYRYAPTNSMPALEDIVWFFMVTYFPERLRASLKQTAPGLATEDAQDRPRITPSGLYKKVFLKESQPEKLIWAQ